MKGEAKDKRKEKRRHKKHKDEPNSKSARNFPYDSDWVG